MFTRPDEDRADRKAVVRAGPKTGDAVGLAPQILRECGRRNVAVLAEIESSETGDVRGRLAGATLDEG